MGILLFSLAALGSIADAIGTATGLPVLIAKLMDKEHGYTVEELFARSFRHALLQRSQALSHFASPKDPKVVQVDEKHLTEAIQSLEQTQSVPACISDLASAAQHLAPKFRLTVIIPSHQLPDAEFDNEIKTILEITLTQFLGQIPSNDVAFRATALEMLRESATGANATKEQLHALTDAIRRVEEKVSAIVSQHPCNDPTTTQHEAAKPEFRNPFRIVTAENFDHDYASLARLFRAPIDYEMIRGHENLVIAGGRGCGKSMILKSLATVPAIEIERIHKATNPVNPPQNQQQFTFADSGLDYYGVYIKLFRGFFSQYTRDSKFSEEAAHVFFQHFFNMLVLRATLESLQDACRKQLLGIDATIERQLVTEIEGLAQLNAEEKTLAGIIKAIRLQEQHVEDYVTKLRLSVRNPAYEGRYTSIDKFLDDCCAAICRSVPMLEGRRIYLLLDEFENLADFQQKVVNTLAKLRPTSLTLKIATRAGGMRSMENLQGDAMQFPRDYHMVSLDYDVSKADYKKLLIDVAQKRLASQGFKETNIAALLPSAPKYAPSSEEEVDAAIRRMLADRGDDVGAYTPEAWNEKLHQWGEATIFRLNESRQKPRMYAGVDDFVQLSSGIISNFLELCKMAVYMATWDGIKVNLGDPIPARTQNEAVYKTSDAAFEWIGKNIANTGPAVSRLVADMSAIVREKLLFHSSEPEAARIAIKDPAAIDLPKNSGLQQLLDDAVRWSVLQSPSPTKAYLPKHREDGRQAEYLINRILHPALRISKNLRWTTQFLVSDLAQLCDEDTRKRKRLELIRKHSGRVRLNQRPAKTGSTPLFPAAKDKQKIGDH